MAHLVLGARIAIRVRNELLRFGLFYSHRRSMSNTNLPRGESNGAMTCSFFSSCSNSRWRPTDYPCGPQAAKLDQFSAARFGRLREDNVVDVD